MKKQLRYLVLLCCMLSSFFAKAQTVPPHLDSLGQKITLSLSDYYKKYPQEKVFIHTDQNTYLSGQTCWYKAYTQAYGKPSQLSKILYVCLLDANGKLIKQNKLPIKNSTAYGNFNLSDSLHTGWYQIQSFTAWMLNFDKEGFYHQAIYVKNVHDKSAEIADVRGKKNYHTTFFPEGGDLVDGNICNIAFKAVDENGLPVKIDGFVQDNTKKTVAKLTTLHDGMGAFDLETFASADYTARVHYPDNTIQEIALPKVKKTGIAIRVNMLPADELEVKIPYNGKQAHKNILIAAVQNNGLNATYPLELSRGTNVFSFKKNNFSTGILRLTVFDESGFPRAERIVYINNHDQLQPTVAADTVSFDQRAKNAFIINLKDEKGQPIKANFSIAITDAWVGSELDGSISSYLLMSSELHGYIHQPAWYFKNNSDTLQQQLDLVMLTNGWRHFKWDTVLNNKPLALTHFVEHEQFVAGKVENYHDKDNLKIKLIVVNSDSTKMLSYVEPDSAGVFTLNDYNRKGTAKMYFEAVNAKKKQPLKIDFYKPEVDIDHLPTDSLSISNKTNPVINRSFLDSVAIEQKEKFITDGIMLKTLNVKALKLTPTQKLINSHVKNLDFDHGYTLDLINDHSAISFGLIPFIQGKFPGLIITPSIDGLGASKFTYRGAVSVIRDSIKANLDPPGTPSFYIDENRVQLSDAEQVSLQDVALIRYAPPPVWFAPLNGGATGAILIYTRNYEDNRSDAKKANGPLNQYVFNSYSITREFSSPDYSLKSAAHIPDYRTTLYWSHDLTTDAQGNCKINFYNSDKAKKYRVTIQAMDAEGHVGYITREISGK